MDPGAVLRWEPVLQSQYAVALLLIAALIGSLLWCLRLHRENQELNKWVREHLQAQADFGRVLDNVREAMRLRETSDEHPL
jgi:hypothetical protein